MVKYVHFLLLNLESHYPRDKRSVPVGNYISVKHLTLIYSLQKTAVRLRSKIFVAYISPTEYFILLIFQYKIFLIVSYINELQEYCLFAK